MKFNFFKIGLLLVMGMTTLVFNACNDPNEPEQEIIDPDNPKAPPMSRARLESKVLL